jgi:hypothetical protein
VRLIAFVEYAAVIVGILAVVAGRFFALANGVHLGIFLIGVGIALGGAEAVVTRRMAFRSSEDAYEAYAGAPALIVGIMALLIGTAIVGAAYLLSDGTWHSTVSYLTRRPAPVLVFIGVLVVGVGILLMLNPQGRSGIAWTLLLYVPRVLVGIVLVAAGLGGIGLAAWEWLDPRAFDRFVADLPRLVQRASRWLPSR